MSHETTRDPVDVLAKFTRKGLEPVAFKWHGRRVDIRSVNLCYDSMAGRERILHFAVSDTQAAYQLDYYSLQQRWLLSGYYVE